MNSISGKRGGDAEVVRRILEHPGYPPEKNLRLSELFRKGPRYLTSRLINRYGLDNKRVAEVGCGFGNNLIHFGEGSYGVEIDPEIAKLPRHLGLEVHVRDVIERDLDDLPKTEAVLCMAVLEHVVSPHILLRRLFNLLEPEGLVFVYVPTVPLLPVLGKLKRLKPYLTAHRHGDHINAFTPATLRFMCERAGFETVDVTPLYPSVLGILDHVPGLNRLVDGCMFVGRRPVSWDYPKNSLRRATGADQGFRYRLND